MLHVIVSEAETPSASKYLQQLCKHFAHKVPSTWSTEAGAVEFPFGHCEMQAADHRLSIRCSTPDEGNLPRLQGVIDSHIATFAFREKLQLQWRRETA